MFCYLQYHRMKVITIQYRPFSPFSNESLCCDNDRMKSPKAAASPGNIPLEVNWGYLLSSQRIIYTGDEMIVWLEKSSPLIVVLY